MKVYNSYEIGQLLHAAVSGDAEIVYAREDKAGFVYFTVKYRAPMIKDLPKLENEPTI